MNAQIESLTARARRAGNAARGFAWVIGFAAALLIVLGAVAALRSLASASNGGGDKPSAAPRMAVTTNRPPPQPSRELVSPARQIDLNDRVRRATVVVRTTLAGASEDVSGFVLKRLGTMVLIGTQKEVLLRGRVSPQAFAVLSSTNLIASAYPLTFDDGRGSHLAVLVVSDEQNVFGPGVEFADRVEPGRALWCGGNPLGTRFASSQGYAVRVSDALVDHDCVIGRGSGGGPVLNSDGQLVGLLLVADHAEARGSDEP